MSDYLYQAVTVEGENAISLGFSADRERAERNGRRALEARCRRIFDRATTEKQCRSAERRVRALRRDFTVVSYPNNPPQYPEAVAQLRTRQTWRNPILSGTP